MTACDDAIDHVSTNVRASLKIKKNSGKRPKAQRTYTQRRVESKRTKFSEKQYFVILYDTKFAKVRGMSSTLSMNSYQFMAP